VDVPVKFIARNDEKLDMKNISEKATMRLPSRERLRNKSKVLITPITSPLNEKLRVGIYGRSNGVITIPAKYPAVMIFIIMGIFVSALWNE